jgi:hypothetical protein
VVVGGDVDAGHRGQDRGHQAALERPGEVLGLVACPFGVGAGLFGFLPRSEQFVLVGAPIAGIEDRGADQPSLPVAAGLDHGGHQHRQSGPVGGLQFECHTAQLTLHAQQWRDVRLVVDPPADGEQVGEPALPDDLVTLVAEPTEQRRVDLDDRAVEQGRQVPARGVVVEILGAVLEQRRQRRTGPVLPCVDPVCHGELAKSAIAAAVASGALSCGQ